jgi:integrase
LDKLPVGKHYKQSFRLTLKEFMRYCIKFLPNKPELRIKYDNILTDDDFDGFSDNIVHMEFSYIKEKAELYGFLDAIRARSFENYIFFCLLTFTGMRIGGALNIIVDNIDLIERKIVTKEKHTKKNGLNNHYVIPKPFAKQLESYILQMKTNYPTRIKLFEKSYNYYFNQFQSIEVGKHPHLLRDSINSFRMKKGLNESVMAILLNQDPVGVNAKHYLRLLNDFSVRRDFFDYYFPFYGYFKGFSFDIKEWKEIERNVKDCEEIS